MQAGAGGLFSSFARAAHELANGAPNTRPCTSRAQAASSLLCRSSQSDQIRKACCASNRAARAATPRAVRF